MPLQILYGYKCGTFCTHAPFSKHLTQYNATLNINLYINNWKAWLFIIVYLSKIFFAIEFHRKQQTKTFSDHQSLKWTDIYLQKVFHWNDEKKVNLNNARHQTKLSLRSHSVSWLLTQAWGDWLVSGWAESAWQASENRSRARSQFLWVLFLASVASSTDTTAPEPRPDWALRICSWIYNKHTQREVSVNLMHLCTWHCVNKWGETILPDPSFQLRPCRGLLLVSSPSSPASVYPYSHPRFHYIYTHTQWEKAQVCENIFNLDTVTQEIYCSADRFYRGKCLTE